MEQNKTIFLSYCWGNKKIADYLDSKIQAFEGIEIKRDIREIYYSHNIEDFMKTIRKTDHVILLISKEYLMSVNCMFEVSQIVKDYNYVDKITPIIIDRTSIYGPDNRLKYAQYWNKKYHSLNEEIRKLNIEDNISLIQELKKVKNICSAIDEILDILNKKKYHDLETHVENDFNDTFKAMNFKEIPNKKKIQLEEEVIEHFKYTLYKLEDVSTGSAKRYSATILLNDNYTTKQIKELIRHLTDKIKMQAYYRNTIIRNRFKNKLADVVWLYIAKDLFDIQTTNWFCRTSWISSDLEKAHRPLQLNGTDKVDDIVIQWNQSYEGLKKAYKSYVGTKEEILDKTDKILSEMCDHSKRAAATFKQYNESLISEEEFIKAMQDMEDRVRKLYIDSTNIPLPTEELKNYLDICNNVFTIIDNMFMYYSDKGINTWDSSSRNFQMNESIKELDKILPVVEYERNKIR
ncbi:toll/interleukin-1 receptor domain-containing protein [Desulfofalx alkaliphila]|uniref:toll/interleukin-1 receptor domain-containing protein n=1 Tax=Desulfofalx alkaliphila TaxID=105483 RepID=UPI0004E1040C|nr:toll/interleukin-1 receptor domain-containing protein [Desulfofalx alkaliphila]